MSEEKVLNMGVRVEMWGGCWQCSWWGVDEGVVSRDTGGRGGHTWQVHCEFFERF